MKKQLLAILTASALGFSAEATHFTFKSGTDEFVPVYLLANLIPTLDGTALEAGDEIGVFSKKGLCTGAIKWDANGQPQEIAAWSDDSQTKTVVDGLVNGDTLYFKFYDASANREFTAQGVTQAGSIVYNTTDIGYVLSSLTALTPVEITSDPVGGSKNRKESIDLTVTATGGGTVTYQWQKDGNNIPVGTAATYAITSVANSDDGSYRCIVTNGTSADTSAAAVLTVTNQKPTVTSANGQTINEDQTLDLTVGMTNGADADNDPLELVVLAGTGYTVTGTAITPAADFNGDLTVPVKVTDGIDTSAAMDLVITVTPVNDAPVRVIENADTLVELDSAMTLTLSSAKFSDVDRDLLKITVTGLPAGLLFADSTISGIPTVEGSYEVVITATDDSGAIAEDTVTITVERTVAITKQYGDLKTPFAAYPNPATANINAVMFPIPGTGRAELTIFDQLGAILDHQTLDVTTNDHLEWDLCNESGVRVGSGSYVAILTIVSTDGTAQQYKTMIGVQR